ncbi:NADPH-dependent FMN reductase [Peribacillus cavernae]|uniref:NADPH-dependent FMN reductase n=1 Tax=Peribacillus cavernae TaxID=1674310 RepID=UPI001FE27AC7|nr:NAD(P)H-dependent oxidoreductase [Peribacillus cavernae]MDQ0219489.1 NAD(P)H-dependent FMN reductase [Peribacillus cavernae]
MYVNSFHIEILNIRDLPHFDQDIENDPPEIVKEFKKQMAEADAVLYVTPEYNYSIPGVLKNTID